MTAVYSLSAADTGRYSAARQCAGPENVSIISRFNSFKPGGRDKRQAPLVQIAVSRRAVFSKNVEIA